MVNLSVPFQRLNYALQTLVSEVRARYGGAPVRVDTVTGWKSQTNFTGHNADSNGVVHAVDIFVGTPGNLTQEQATDLVNWLQTEGPKGAIPGHPDRMYYMIFRDRIMGDWSGWTSWDGSGYGHWDHIHISTCDLYWGDPAPIPAGDYDSTAPWGLSTINPAGGGTINPIEGFLMALSDAEQADLKRKIDYIASPDFKAHIFNGSDQRERDARAGFLNDVGSAVVNRDLDWWGFGGQVPAEGRRTTTIALNAGWDDTRQAQTVGLLNELSAKVDALTKVVAAGSDLTSDEVAAIINEAVEKSFGQYRLELTKVVANG